MEKNYQCRVVGRESNVEGSTYLCGPGESKRELKFLFFFTLPRVKLKDIHISVTLAVKMASVADTALNHHSLTHLCD